MLQFSPANGKLEKLAKKLGLRNSQVFSLDLLAGQTCPGANLCKSHVVEVDGRRKVKDGPHCQFRCFAASLEALFPKVYDLHKRNTLAIRQASGVENIAHLIYNSIPQKAKVIRYHSFGDFFKMDYFLAAVEVAKLRPDIHFYAYTKSIPFTVGVTLPSNFALIHSLGGKWDDMDSGLYTAKVVYSQVEADSLGLEIDTDDSHAYFANKNFALLIHGTQPAKKR